MTLVIESKNFPQHFPADPNNFKFDAEVATIFENMAVRSIPNYREMHSVNAQLMLQHKKEDEEYVVVDYGASTGMAMKALCNHLQLPHHQRPEGFRYIALDNSPDMLAKVVQQVPWAETIDVDCTDSDELQNVLWEIEAKPNCILMLYFLQFLPRPHQLPVMRIAHDLLKKNGLLMFGCKEVAMGTDRTDDWFNSLYIDLRKEMGYTVEEIRAKTAALSGSMHTQTGFGLHRMLSKAGFDRLHETTRWLQFMSLIATK